MENKKYKPAIDKYFWVIWIPLTIILIVSTYFSISELLAFFIMLGVDIFCYYFMISSLFGYVELRKDLLYIKFGFIIKKEIPYDKIRKVIKEKKFVTHSMLSLKNAFEHINIEYNKFDMVTVSVKDNNEFTRELEERIMKATNK